MDGKTRDWYKEQYKHDVSNSQRKWPNEELARFIGRTYIEGREHLSALEVGCGTGANIRLLIEEGFETYGLDFDEKAIEYCKTKYPSASYVVADMTKLPYNDNTFDCIIDIFSSYCLNEFLFRTFMKEVNRV
ncbi:MAG: class I SAM-dependent methyltransferase [Lachnospiraceae bacterium]|nr:class I SAM-dependent methyltransferase [Lachnospiraceae bacterium]